LGRFTLFVEILDLVLGRHRRGLRFRETRATRIREIAESQHLDRMAGCTDFLVDLEAALKLPLIVSAERPGERPSQLWRGRRIVLLRDCRRSQNAKAACERENDDGSLRLHAGSPAHAFAPSTESEIEFGSGLVFSKMPSSGRMTRKNAK